MSRELWICPGVGNRKCGAFLSTFDRDPHPTCTRCRGRVCAKDMTCGICAYWSAAQWEQLWRSTPIKIERSLLALQALFHLRRWLLPARKLLQEFRSLGLLLLLFPALQVGRGRGRDLRVHLVLRPGRLPPLPLDLGPARGVGVSLDCRLLRALASPAPSGAGEVGVARSQRTSLARSASSVVSPHSSPHAQRRGELGVTSEDRSRVSSSRGSRSSDRGARKDKRACARSSSSRDRGRRSRSRSSSRLRLRGRENRRWSSLRSLSSRVRSRRDRSRSSDHYHSTRTLSFSRRPVSILGSIPVTSSAYAFPCLRFPEWSRDRLRSRDRRPSSPDRSRSGEKGWLARRDQQVGGETGQSPRLLLYLRHSTGVTPAAGGTSLSTLPSAVQDLARFFLCLSESSSRGAVGGVAGVTASAAGSGVQLCPSTAAGGATAIPAGAGDLPAAPTAVPGVSGELQRQEVSRSCRRRRRSSSDGTDRRSKKHSRRRSPSPVPSSRCRERHYWASSSSSEEDRADASPLRAGRAPGGTSSDSRSSRAYDRSPHPGTSRSFARGKRYRPGAGRRSPAPSGAADCVRSCAFGALAGN